MVKLRHLLSALIIGSTLITTCAVAQSLTEIRDTVLNANGSPFTGTVVITWNGFTGPSGGTISPLSTSAKIYNGALSVLLVPTTTASAGTYYQAVYNSNDGLVTWSETWQVPPSPIPLTLSQIRQSSNQGGGNGGTSGGGGTGSGTTQFATLPISIDQVTDLGADLASINSSLSSLTTQLNNLGLASTTTNAIFVDAETPTGAPNGSNVSFTLANAPSPGGSLTLYRNGLVQSNSIDYTLSGATITFSAGSIPQTGDILQAYYRISGTGPTATFSDAEIPAGIIDGVNLAFTLAATPNPANSLKLYKNGVLLQLNGDYTLNGSTVTFVNATVAPQPGDKIVANYRH
jgi:hypothetical protein